MKIIENERFPLERALYGEDGVRLVNCVFDGEEDGESALKEAQNVELVGCRFNLRYPLWHDVNVKLDDVTLTPNCRAALWYARNIQIKNSRLLGIKALRECDDAEIYDSSIISPEFGWKSRGVKLDGGEIESEYLFLEARNVQMSDVKFKGKYSFQYTQNVTVENCVLDTKDAFWHAKDVTVKNSIVKGEYLAWYSSNLTLINCKIIGTQPLCYCQGLKLVNCQMEGTDFSFEYSQVDAVVQGNILSVKNPRSGKIIADGIGELIYTDDSKYKCECEVTVKTPNMRQKYA